MFGRKILILTKSTYFSQKYSFLFGCYDLRGCQNPITFLLPLSTQVYRAIALLLLSLARSSGIHLSSPPPSQFAGKSNDSSVTSFWLFVPLAVSGQEYGGGGRRSSTPFFMNYDQHYWRAICLALCCNAH